jgi:hypothetical protein
VHGLRTSPRRACRWQLDSATYISMASSSYCSSSATRGLNDFFGNMTKSTSIDYGTSTGGVDVIGNKTDVSLYYTASSGSSGTGTVTTTSGSASTTGSSKASAGSTGGSAAALATTGSNTASLSAATQREPLRVQLRQRRLRATQPLD